MFFMALQIEKGKEEEERAGGRRESEMFAELRMRMLSLSIIRSLDEALLITWKIIEISSNPSN
jgi:hypothetical protein